MEAHFPKLFSLFQSQSRTRFKYPNIQVPHYQNVIRGEEPRAFPLGAGKRLDRRKPLPSHQQRA
jgi:hypothetical protein